MGNGWPLQVVNASITACQKAQLGNRPPKKCPEKKTGSIFGEGQVRVGRGYIFQLDVV